MIEAAAFIFAIYASASAMPWWTATAAGALAGIYHVLANRSSGPRAEIIKAAPESERAALELSMGVWTVGAAVVLFTALYYVVRLIVLISKQLV